MSSTTVELYGEKKNKRKGAFYSVTLHALLLLIAILPFLDPPADIDKNFAIVIEFEKPIVRKSGSSSKKSAASSSSEAANKPSEDNPKPNRTVEKVTKIEKTEIKPTTPTTVKEVITAPDIEVQKWPDPVKAPERIESTVPTTQTRPTNTEEPSIDDFLPILDQIIEEDESGTGTGSGELGDSDFDPNANGSGGDGGDGVGKKDNGGKATGSGTGPDDAPPGGPGDGDGFGGVGFDGEGPLTRKVKKLAICQSLVRTSGIIYLDLCINRNGNITYSKYNLKKSTLKNRSAARKWTSCFRKTVFHKDLDAPFKECGTKKYTITIDD